jgi:hypothetical protein
LIIGLIAIQIDGESGEQAVKKQTNTRRCGDDMTTVIGHGRHDRAGGVVIMSK